MTTTFSGASGNGSHGPDSESSGFGQRVDQIGSSAQQLWTEARTAVNDLGDTLDLKGRVQRNPYGMMLAALGVGYLLGGGLFTPLTGRLVRFGIKLSALPFVKDELAGMADAALHGFLSGVERGGGAPSSPGA